MRLSKEITKAKEDFMSRLQWTAFIQVVTTLAALSALAKLL